MLLIAPADQDLLICFPFDSDLPRKIDRQRLKNLSSAGYQFPYLNKSNPADTKSIRLWAAVPPLNCTPIEMFNPQKICGL